MQKMFDKTLPKFELSKAQDSKELLLKASGSGTPATLSKILPILENFGVCVISADNENHADGSWQQVYHLQPKSEASIDLDTVHGQIEEGLTQIWEGMVESDRLNELVLTSNLSSRDVTVLRALAKYMI